MKKAGVVLVAALALGGAGALALALRHRAQPALAEAEPAVAAPREIASIPESAAAPAAALVALADRPARDVGEYKAAIAELAACYDRDCGFERTYPREYTNVLAQRLKAKLFAFADYAQESGAHGADIAEVARAQLAVADGHVKEAALHLIATQDASPENRDAILSDVIAYHDDALVPQALLELRRYDPQAPQIQDALIAAMAQGAPYVAAAISQGIAPFITDATYDRYEQSLARLSPGTKAYIALNAALEEHRLHRTGG